MLRAGVVVAVASWGALITGLLPATPSGLAVAATLTALALLIVELAARRSPLRERPVVRTLIDRTLFGAAVIVALLELGLRTAGALLPASPTWLPASSSVDAQLAAFRYEPGAVHFFYPCNSLGFYDEEPPGPESEAPWVACIGDSFVASSVPQPVHFPTVAELDAKVVVQAFGVAAAGPREYVALLERDVLPHAPDAVIVCLFVGNDLSDSARVDTSWFRALFDPQNARLRFVPSRLVIGGTPDRGRHGRVEGDQIIVESPQGELRGDADQFRALMPKLVPWLFDPSLEVPPYTAEEHSTIELGRAVRTCDPSGLLWPELLACLDELLAAAGDTPVGVLLLPDEFQVDDELWAAIERQTAGRGLDRDLAQRRLAEFLRARSVPCLDVLPDLRAAAARGESVFLRRNTHLNLRGNEIVGHALAKFLPYVLPGS